MSTEEFVGHVVAIADYEEDYVVLLETPGGQPHPRGTLSLIAMIRAAGGTTVRPILPDAFESEHGPQQDTICERIHTEAREGYREQTGRHNLPVLRVKFTVEVEALTDEESGRVWSEHMLVRQIQFVTAPTTPPNSGDPTP